MPSMLCRRILALAMVLCVAALAHAQCSEPPQCLDGEQLDQQLCTCIPPTATMLSSVSLASAPPVVETAGAAGRASVCTLAYLLICCLIAALFT